MPSIDPLLLDKMAVAAQAVDRMMDKLLPKSDMAEGKLYEAMRYGTLAGGKRLRPFLVMSGARIFGVDEICALRVAAAVEFVHCYSLMHDDLPAMDNSDLRRGKPTVHKAFDEATAILAGDGLLTFAFEVLADAATHTDPTVRTNLISGLAKASGPNGLVGGQMMDLLAETTPFDIGAITRLQRMKTGELIAYAASAGAILGRANPAHKHALAAFAHDLGLTFQIMDDVLDATATREQMGKPVRADAKKATFVSILGAERARAQAELLCEQACRHLKIFDGRAEDMAEVARFVVARNG